MTIFFDKYDKNPRVPLPAFSDCSNEEEIMEKKTRKKSENEKVLKGKQSKTKQNYEKYRKQQHP